MGQNGETGMAHQAPPELLFDCAYHTTEDGSAQPIGTITA